MGNKVALHNLGCKVNAYEIEAMQQLLEEAGYEIVPFEPGADIYVINTCTVTNIADRKSRQMLHKAKKMNPEAIVVATGCYVQTGGEKLEKDEAIDLVLGNNQKINIVEALAEYAENKPGHGSHVIKINQTKEYEELSMYILAGKKKLREVREGKLNELHQKAAASGLPEDAQAANDLESKCDRFEKKLHDLELTRTISMQTAPQIRMIQNNDATMIEKIQTTIVNTIPLWKSQMVLALGIAHSTEAAQAQRQVTDFTNELLKKNAETLHLASVETAKESQRGIVDIETLKKTNQELIQTLDDVMKIQQEGREKRQAAEADMRRMENELKTKLLEIRR